MTNPTLGASAPAVFNFNNQSIRAFADDKGEPWFLANDICEVLGYSNPRDAISKHCKDPGVAKRDMGVVTGKTSEGGDAVQTVEATYINEGNLYRLIIKSRKPEAEPFERWVCDEVLPTIRKTGRYEMPPSTPSTGSGALLDNPDVSEQIARAVEEALALKMLPVPTVLHDVMLGVVEKIDFHTEEHRRLNQVFFKNVTLRFGEVSKTYIAKVDDYACLSVGQLVLCQLDEGASKDIRALTLIQGNHKQIPLNMMVKSNTLRKGVLS